MKKIYQQPAINIATAMEDDLMRRVSFFNNGEGSTGDDKQQGAGETDNKDIEVDSKHHNAWDTWED